MQQQPSAPQATLVFEHLLLPTGWARDVRVTIDAGRIAAIEDSDAPLPGDEHHACGLPGLPNVHSHAFQRAMAGLTERRGASVDSFWTWRETMYRFVDRMTPDDLHAVAALAYVEMLEGGFTRVGEFHYLHRDRGGVAYDDPATMSAAIAAAANDSGIGLTLLPVLYTYSGFGAAPAKDGQARFVLEIADYACLVEGAERHTSHLADAIVGLAPHSLRAVSPEQLLALAPLAQGRPVHIHIAEQTKEVDDCLAWSGQRPVEWLLGNTEVNRSWCLVHATHVTEAELKEMARRGAIAGLCPITEANLGDGLFPVREFLDQGGLYGIGSDSNVLIDATEELRLLEYGQRLSRRERNVIAGGAGCATGAELYSAALTGGFAALGTAGGIAVGLPADIVSLDLSHPAMAHRNGDAIIDSLIFAAGRTAIDCVWRYGEKQVVGGRHKARDRIVQDYHAALGKLLA